MYTDDKNAQIVLSLLKKYGIKKIVVSPGTTNVPISRSVQLDPWFEVYSVVDERSAAYFATGLAYSSGEPVVISCTGATASRNYLSGMTEAYYRNLPIIALTSQHHVSDFGNLAPQVTDRTVSQNDVKRIAVNLPVVKDDEDYEHCVLSMNKALIAATTDGGGPVHVNLHSVGYYTFTTKQLPDVRKIEYYDLADSQGDIKSIESELSGKKVGIFIGSHRQFTDKSAQALEKFAAKYRAPVFIDHTSGYKGKHAILMSQIADLKTSPNKPDLIIDLGSITGDYSVQWLMGIETWRLSEDREVHDRFHNQTKLFAGKEDVFFDTLSKKISPASRHDYYGDILREIKTVTIPCEDIPLSNTYISYKLSTLLPKGSNLHMGILNSLRNMNFFPLDESIDTSSNVGGFGIDGALSTLIGQSMVRRDVVNFGLVGDLAAFYDMNALGIRHIEKNVRILLVNNDGGVEFRLNKHLETQWADDSNQYISAGGHNGKMKGWAESMGFHYLSADTKESFDDIIEHFTSSDIEAFDKPVLFEVFTAIPNEQLGVDIIQLTNRPVSKEPAPSSSNLDDDLGDSGVYFKATVKDRLKKIAPKSVKKVYRRIRGHE